eukprot:5743163-Pyramimonas_sp.AAC.1
MANAGAPQLAPAPPRLAREGTRWSPSGGPSRASGAAGANRALEEIQQVGAEDARHALLQHCALDHAENSEQAEGKQHGT